MPKKIERQLEAEAKKKHFGKARTQRYVYGTMARIKKAERRKKKKKVSKK